MSNINSVPYLFNFCFFNLEGQGPSQGPIPYTYSEQPINLAHVSVFLCYFFNTDIFPMRELLGLAKSFLLLYNLNFLIRSECLYSKEYRVWVINLI